MWIVFGVIVFIVGVSVLPFLKWRREQKERREKLFSRLSKRGDNILNALDKVSDRYLTRDTKIFILDHLISVISVISELIKANYESSFVLRKEELVRMATELSLGQQVTSKDMVANQEQLDQTNEALEYLLKEVRIMPDNFGVSRSVVRHHLLLIRYANALVYRDLLVRQARQDLDNDRKSQALEKYRDALALIEKNGSVASSKREKVRLKKMIKDVETLLFKKEPSESRVE
ncbi:hypothetical protein J9B83_05100 [Marinomonas sp. A79]|uniref:Uncharacterized protein n=1 Tax=Marinomonas vulgaris TaxID=2823372 RepID=A0ABS5HA15_9GAMM|nr:hypothetical protein [Marinomonas vulgaris]MBR7888315.1 hypothetical protein [Marinomonas vulgaris]